MRFLDAAWGVVVAYDNFQPVVLMDACKELAKVGQAETAKRLQESLAEATRESPVAKPHSAI